jgi:hypothetical protein
MKRKQGAHTYLLPQPSFIAPDPSLLYIERRWVSDCWGNTHHQEPSVLSLATGTGTITIGLGRKSLVVSLPRPTLYRYRTRRSTVSCCRLLYWYCTWYRQVDYQYGRTDFYFRLCWCCLFVRIMGDAYNSASAPSSQQAPTRHPPQTVRIVVHVLVGFACGTPWTKTRANGQGQNPFIQRIITSQSVTFETCKSRKLTNKTNLPRFTSEWYFLRLPVSCQLFRTRRRPYNLRHGTSGLVVCVALAHWRIWNGSYC